MKRLLFILLATLLVLPAMVGNGEAAAKGKILLVTSSNNQLTLKDGRNHPTGYFLDEFAVPALAFKEAGYEVIVATPRGNVPTMDPVSNNVGLFNNDQAALNRALDYVQKDNSVNHPIKIADAIAEGLDNYVAVYVPGGHSPMTDLMQDKDFGKVLRYFHEHNKVTAFLCHGPIASLAALDDAAGFRAALVAGDYDEQAAKGANWQYAGYNMTVYSTAEELSVEEFVLKGILEFHVADALQIAGGTVIEGPLNKEHVVRDRELITGQNPASDHAIAKAVLAALEE